MKLRTWMFAGGGTLAAVALLAWAFAPRPAEVEVATVTQGHFETTIDEDGKTRLRERYVVSAPLAGLLTRITLREGDAVDARLASLRSVCQDHRGRTPLFVHVLLPDEEVVVRVKELLVDPGAAMVAKVESLLGPGSILVEYAGRA